MTSHPDCVYPRCWCELGKCAARAKPTESLRLLMMPLADYRFTVLVDSSFDPPRVSHYEYGRLSDPTARALAYTIPNRLHGAAINAEGCAI